MSEPTLVVFPFVIGAEHWPPRKEDATCCVSRRDELGRLPLGFCSELCIRRPKHWQRLVRALQRQGVRRAEGTLRELIQLARADISSK